MVHLSEKRCKYGRSRIYDQAFKQAEAEAQAKNLVIWNPQTNQGGPSRDYLALISWWELRDSQVEDYRQLESNQQILSVRLDYPKILELAKTEETITIFADLQNGINKSTDQGSLIYAGSEFHKFNLWIPNPESNESIEIINLVEKRFAAQNQGIEKIGGRSYVYVTGKVEMYKDIPQIVVTSYQQITDIPPR